MQVIDVGLYEKQLSFVQDQTREVMFSGAYASGKTVSLAWKTIIRASHPSTREILARKFHSTIAQTTLKTLLRLLPEGSYHYRKSEDIISIHGGGDIELIGLDSAKLGSRECTGVNLDEGLEASEDEYLALLGRIRLSVPGVVQQINIATNPGSPSHYLAKRFGIGGNPPTPNTSYVQTCTYDNLSLNKEFLDNLSTFTGVAKTRLVLGQWVQASGLVYPDLLSCVISPKHLPDGSKYGSVDWGYKDPFCALLGVVYKSSYGNILYVYAEHYKSEEPIEQHVAHMNKMIGSYGATWFAPPDDPENARELRVHNMTVNKAENSILYGVDAVNGLIAMDRLFISSECSNIIRECSSFVWDKTKDMPLDINGHSLAALRYLVASLKKIGVL